MAKRGRPAKVQTESFSTADFTSTQTVSAPMSVVSYDLLLGIRRIRYGNFSGLWELNQLNPATGAVDKVLTDANIKTILLAQIGRALSKCF